MDMKVLIYILSLPLMVARNEGVTRCITPDHTLLPIWKDYPAIESYCLYRLKLW